MPPSRVRDFTTSQSRGQERSYDFSNQSHQLRSRTHQDFRSYSRHDDIVDNRRRVTFEPDRYRISKHDRKPDRRLLRNVRLDDDVTMAGTSGNSGRNANRFVALNPKRGRGWKRQGRDSPGSQNRARLSESASWFKVTIPHGAKYEKDFILRLLFSHIAPTTFIPIAYRVHANEASFFVEDQKIANELALADRKMTLSDGYKIQVRVHPSTPKFDLNAALKSKVTTVIGKRYNSDTHALDLERFHLDQDLVQDSFCALSNPNLMKAVLDIISEKIPELVALNLSGNKIDVIDHLSSLSTKMPNLKVLHLGTNKIHEMIQLNSLHGLPIVELDLQGNPLCSKYTDQSLYVREVRKLFPKLVKLDGTDLPPQITPNISNKVNTPSPKENSNLNQEVQILVKQFLQNYYTLFDGENRGLLLDAYHPNAILFMSVADPAGYWLNQQGKSAILNFITHLPETLHDPSSFTVDVPIFTPQLIKISLSGLFKETKSPGEPIRSFKREFVIVPAEGGGISIVNEMFFVTNTSTEQEEAAFKSPQLQPAVPAEPCVSSRPTAPLEEGVMHEQMVQAMCHQSGMIAEFSRKCLMDNGWDFQRAVFIFTELHKQGKIPEKAFFE